MIGYALLGATWLIMRTEGSLQERAFRYANRLALGTVAAILVVSALTPFLEQEYWRRWFEMPGILATAPVPLLVAVGTFLLFRSLKLRRDRSPFLLTLGLFFLCFVGLGVSIFPDIVPGEVGIAEAAAPESSLIFVLVGAAFLIPLILAYTAWSYWVFRGKTGHEGYH